MPTKIAMHGGTGARIARTLREAILAGDYQPGERIRQDEIADKHGASRLPVREALRMLEAEGLVTLVANTGAWVSKLDADECREMYLIRERIEPLLLRMNVPLLPTSEVDRLDRLAESMQATDDVEYFLRLDRDFHLSPLRFAPTIVLSGTVEALWNRTHFYRRAVSHLYFSGGDHSAHYDHFLIVNALRRQDADEAEQVLARHIRRSRLELDRHREVFVAADPD